MLLYSKGGRAKALIGVMVEVLKQVDTILLPNTDLWGAVCTYSASWLTEILGGKSPVERRLL